MNKTVKQIFAGLTLITILSGCVSPITSQQQRQQVTQSLQPEQLPVVSTSSTGQLTTNFVTVEVPVLKTNIVTVTVTNGFQESPSLSNTVATISAVNQMTAPFNPYSGLINLLLGGATAVAGVVAAIKSKQANTATGIASTVISAVENLAPTIAPAVKTTVAATALQNGTSDAVHALVQELTGAKTDPA